MGANYCNIELETNSGQVDKRNQHLTLNGSLAK